MGVLDRVFDPVRQLIARLIRALAPRNDRLPDEWTQRLVAMKGCSSTEDISRQFGEPAHKVGAGELQIWHYPLGIRGGFLYSIRVVASPNGLTQVYMHLEPTA